MTTITLDDHVINEVVAIGHYQNVQEAVRTILNEYLQQHKQVPTLFDQLRVPNDIADDALAAKLFERNSDKGRDIEL